MNDNQKKGASACQGVHVPPLARAPTLFLLFLILLGGLAFAAVPAEAHANLLSGDPPQNRRVDDPPATFVLRFTEELEPRHVEVRVLDKQDQDRVVDLQVADSRTRVDVQVGELERGIYTVRWEVLSAVDGHPTSGGYLVAVAMDIPEGTDLPTQDDVVDVRFWETVGRAAAYAGASLLVGIPVYLLYRFRFVPVKGWLHAPVTERVTRDVLLMRLAAWGGIVSAAAVTALIIALAGRIDDGLVKTVTTTASGSMLAVRAVLLLAASALALQAARAGRRLPWIAAALAVALAALVATSLGAHAASTQVGIHWLNITMDILHQLAAAAWIAGVVVLLLTVPRVQEARTAGILVRDFSPFAVGAVIVLVGTGVYGSLVHMEDPLGVLRPESGWQWALLAKIALVVPLILLGAYNRYVVQPRLLGGADDTVVPRIKRSVRAEVVLMAIVLIATGALTHATPPAQIDAPPTGPPSNQVTEHETDSGDVFRVTLSPTPLVVSLQNLSVIMEPVQEVPENAAVYVTIHGPDGGEDGPFQLQRVGDEPRWFIRDVLFNQQGGWHVDVLVQGRAYFEGFEFIVIVEGAEDEKAA